MKQAKATKELWEHIVEFMLVKNMREYHKKNHQEAVNASDEKKESKKQVVDGDKGNNS